MRFDDSPLIQFAVPAVVCARVSFSQDFLFSCFPGLPAFLFFKTFCFFVFMFPLDQAALHGHGLGWIGVEETRPGPTRRSWNRAVLAGLGWARPDQEWTEIEQRLV